MKRNLFLILALLSITMVSCHKENAPDNQAIDEFTDYTIPFEAALDALDNFMFEQGLVQGTKGSIADYIDNYFVVNGAQRTKSADAQSNVLYAVNFKDDAGYALLAADSRIGEDILAVTEAGSITQEDFLPMDPETWVVTENDDISEAEFNSMVESGVLAAASKSDMHRLCLDYAVERLADDAGPGYSGSGSSYHWEVKKELPRMVTTAWTQEGKDHLFNKYCPVVGLIWRNRAPVGCVNIALGQIIAFHEYPDLTVNGVAIDYPSIKPIYGYWSRTYTGNDTSREMLAQFIWGLCLASNTRFGSIMNRSWGFAWPSDAKRVLELMGYTNVSLDWGYDEERVLQSLDKGCPVFMSAVAHLIAGHAWVIDGYMKRECINNDSMVVKKQTLVHCNWGWHGYCNGYFTSGIFNNRDAVINDFSDPEEDLPRKNSYWYGFNTITYDKPVH